MQAKIYFYLDYSYYCNANKYEFGITMIEIDKNKQKKKSLIKDFMISLIKGNHHQCLSSKRQYAGIVITNNKVAKAHSSTN